MYEKLFDCLQGIVIDKSSVAVSNFFADNAMLAYEDNESIEALNKRAISAYEGCKEEVCSFLTYILSADMLANELKYVDCVVYMPDGDMHVSVGVESPMPSVCQSQELVKTQLGVFDQFTWQMLSSIKREQNPLKICFAHIAEYLFFLMCKLNWRDSDLSKQMVTAELLDEYHIQETVPIHNSINLYRGISIFCNDGKERYS